MMHYGHLNVTVLQTIIAIATWKCIFIDPSVSLFLFNAMKGKYKSPALFMNLLHAILTKNGQKK
jgi:hypothetical protein